MRLVPPTSNDVADRQLRALTEFMYDMYLTKSELRIVRTNYVKLVCAVRDNDI